MSAQPPVSAQEMPLLRTKLYIPPPRPELVPRPHLIEQLNAGLHRKLTLISAPAGFGKTTLVSEWVASHRRGGPRSEAMGEPTLPVAVAWLSLDESDNDPTRFLVYVIAALQAGLRAAGQTVEADIAEAALGALQSPQPPPTEAILTALINEITTLPGRVVLVLDDYHLIESRSIHDILTFLLRHLPPHTGPGGQCQGMHLVIASREDPPLPLAHLRARGQLTELRIADLRFTPPEAALFFSQVMGLDLSAEEVASLESRTEGWITGLQLAALALQGPSMREREDISGFISAFAGDNRYIVDYLVQEVLRRQPERVRSFLLQTSILDRLSGPLCDALQFGSAKLERPGDARRAGSSEGTPVHPEKGRALLEALERGNLFVVPLDDRRQWYRYHHLFADVLQARLMAEQPDLVPTLHRRASEWYERNDLPSDAIRHALAAQDPERAADLAERAWPAWSGSFQSLAWLGWVKELPDELVRARPVLCVAYAWAFLNAGMLEAAEARLLDAERWLEPTVDASARREDPSTEMVATRTGPEQRRRMVVVDQEQFRSLPASLATARAYHAQAIGDVSATVKYARRVLDLVPEGAPQWRGDATALLGLAHWARGDLEAAHQTFNDDLAGMEPLDVIVGTFVLADIKSTLGHLHEAVRTCERALQLAADHGDPMPIGTEDVYTEFSKLHRERGDLRAAAQDLRTAKRLGDQVELPDWQYRWCIAQAQLKATLGDLDDALDLLDQAERVYVRTPLPDVRPIAAMRARVWIAQGSLAKAQRWAREQGLSVDDDLTYLREFEHITLARVLIARYRNDRVERSIHQAVGLLERLLKAAQGGGRTGSAIEILVLQALACQAQGDLPAALASLRRAFVLAEPEGYVRIFVDAGPPMAALLREAAKQSTALNYVRQLRAAFGEAPVSAEATGKRPGTQPLSEPLSERELQVLRLIAEGLSNREIGERLFVALNTVKGHNRKIFGKLAVQRRTEAVARARELGLL